MTLCTYLEDIKKKLKDLSQNQLLEHFNKLLQVSNSNTTLICLLFFVVHFVSLIIRNKEDNAKPLKLTYSKLTQNVLADLFFYF